MDNGSVSQCGQIVLEGSEATRLLIALSRARDALAATHANVLPEVQNALWELAARMTGQTKAKLL